MEAPRGANARAVQNGTQPLTAGTGVFVLIVVSVALVALVVALGVALLASFATLAVCMRPQGGAGNLPALGRGRRDAGGELAHLTYA